MLVKNVEFSGGNIILVDPMGNRVSYPITPTAANIPNLTISSLTLLTNLAQVVMVLVKTLVEQKLLDEELVAGFDLQYVLETLVDDLNAEEV